MPDLLALKDSLKTEANRLGFTHLGIAPVLPAPDYAAYLGWVENGCHAEMAYLDRSDTRTKRGNPGLILEDCQRVICLALPYNPPEAPLNFKPHGKGRISAYARTQDYHTVIWERMAQLETFIRQQAGEDVHLKSYVDTGPILERSYATRAGIGIAGKNSCLLIQGTGSYFFLAEILTDLPLPLDEPYTRDLCGSCQRCVDACPTNCILPNRTLDASRCISYLTIEKRGALQDAFKDQLDNWLFGCDVCQMVCPHNARTPENQIVLGEPALPEFLDLAGLFHLSEDEFKTQFGPTPLSRSHREGLLRNAALVLGHQRAQAALPTLKAALIRETDPNVLEACRWAIRQIENN